MTLNAKTVLNYLKAHYGTEVTKADMAKELGLSIPAVTGSVRGLVSKKLATERIETVELEPATETRKAKTKDIRHVQLTEAGLVYDPDAAEAAAE